MLLKASKIDPPIGAVLTANATKKELQMKVEWGKETSFAVAKDLVLTNSASIIRYVIVIIFLTKFGLFLQ